MHLVAFIFLFAAMLIFSVERSIREKQLNIGSKHIKSVLLLISIIGGVFILIIKVIDVMISPVTWMGMWFFYLQVLTIGSFMMGLSFCSIDS